MKKISLIIGGMTPAVALAATFSNLTDVINFFTNLIYSAVIPLLVALALVYFLYGVATFIRNADNATEQTKGKDMMIWGIVALFVIVSVWGIVGVLANTFGVRVGVPGAPGSSSLPGGTPPPNNPSIEDCLKKGTCL